MSLEGSYKKLGAANLTRAEKYVKLIEALLSKATGRFVSLSSPLNYDKGSGELFDFSNYPELRKEIDGIVSKLARGMFTTIKTGTSREWANGTDDANGIIDYVLKRIGYKSTSDLEKDVLGKYLNNHDSALRAFQERAIGGMDLSTKVWNLANRCKMESELARSIADGTSAREIASSMKEYLNEPSNLFRRVRDEFGELQLSRRARAYEPGAGVYRSSYKNALRLARTEINMAYRNAEQESYQDKDYVVGIEIHRSQIDYDCDVCGQLAGKYPKNFKWSGWHPNCRCYMTPILLTDEEMDARTDAIINGDDFDATGSKNYVEELPDNFQEWFGQNQDRILASYGNGTTPYFIKDNELLMKSFGGDKLSSFSENYRRYQDIVSGGKWIGLEINDYTPRQLMEMSVDDFSRYYEEKQALIHNMMADYTNSRLRVSDLEDYLKKHVNPGIDEKQVKSANKLLSNRNMFASLKERILSTLGIQESAVLDGLGSDIQAYMGTLKAGDISDLELRSFVRVVCNSDPKLATIKRISTGYNDELFAYCRSGDELFLSKTAFRDCGGFRMVNDLKGALSSILSKTELTFNQEYAVECLWHEMKHGTAKGWVDLFWSKNQTSANAMETINQYCARREYPAFLKMLGAKSAHLADIKSGGYGYRYFLDNFGSVLSKYSIKEGTAFNYFSGIIQTRPYEDMYSAILDFLKANTKGLSEDTLIHTIDGMFKFSPTDYLSILNGKGFAV